MAIALSKLSQDFVPYIQVVHTRILKGYIGLHTTFPTTWTPTLYVIIIIPVPVFMNYSEMFCPKFKEEKKTNHNIYTATKELILQEW